MEDTGMVGLGIIGAGRIAQVHARAYQNVAGARLLAAADVVREAADATAAAFGLDAYYDYHDLLARDDIDGVIVAVPSPLHASIVVDVARAGKHVFCQKPMAPTLAEADTIIAACREAGVTLQVGFMLRSTPPITQIKAMVDAGTLGDLVALRAAAFGWEPNGDWFYQVDKGGGVIVDTMIHFLDLWHWLGGDVRSVHALGGAYVLDGSKRFASTDNAHVSLAFVSGAMGSILGSWTTGYGDLFFEVYGTKGTAFVDFLQRQTGMVYLRTASGATPAGWTFNQVIWSVGYEAEARRFIAAIEGKAPPAATGENGRVALELALAAEESLRTGGVVTLPLTTEQAAAVTAPRQATAAR
jgi:myo-inositol 2-dehydrogenase/D-chiro-inositol 1-dehydrogenase